MGLMEPSIVDCFAEIVFQFSGAQVLVGLRKQIINNFVFPTYACAAGFNNNSSVPGGGVNFALFMAYSFSFKSSYS